MRSGSEVRIDISELRKVIDLIFESVQEGRPDGVINLEQDYYWEPFHEKIYNVSEALDPKSFSMGSLVDDWQFLQKVLGDESMAVQPMFMHVYPLLRYLAYKSSFPDLEADSKSKVPSLN